VLNSLSPLSNETDQVRGDSGRLVYRFKHGQIPPELKEQAQELQRSTSVLRKGVMQVLDWMEEAMEGKRLDITRADVEGWYPLIGTHYARSEAVDQLWQSYAREEREGDLPSARWLNFYEHHQGIDIELASSPVLAADVLKNYLWNRCYAAIVTSATLMAAGDFGRFKMRSGVAEDALFQVVPSPFNYEAVGKIQIPDMDFEPSDSLRHTQFIVDFLIAQGKRVATLVLFTSKRQLEEVYDLLPYEYREVTLAQGHVAKNEIIRRHIEAIDNNLPSLIFGLASFAEGIDLPGRYCEHVVIAKLPFSVPEDPIDETLSEWIKAQGGNPFMQIAVPDAAIKLKQAVGRLIRTESDYGVVSILDRRIVKQRYGKALLASLPPFLLDNQSTASR